MPILAHDVEAKLALKLTHSTEQLIEMATGWEYVPEPGIQRVVLVPSYIMRPWNSTNPNGTIRSSSAIQLRKKVSQQIKTHLQLAW